MKLSYMNQFKIVYLIYCIAILVNYFLVLYRYFDKTYLDKGVQDYLEMKLYLDETNEEIRNVIKRNIIAMSFFVIAFFFIMVIKYIIIKIFIL